MRFSVERLCLEIDQLLSNFFYFFSFFNFWWVDRFLGHQKVGGRSPTTRKASGMIEGEEEGEKEEEEEVGNSSQEAGGFI